MACPLPPPSNGHALRGTRTPCAGPGDTVQRRSAAAARCSERGCSRSLSLSVSLANALSPATIRGKHLSDPSVDTLWSLAPTCADLPRFWLLCAGRPLSAVSRRSSLLLSAGWPDIVCVPLPVNAVATTPWGATGRRGGAAPSAAARAGKTADAQAETMQRQQQQFSRERFEHLVLRLQEQICQESSERDGSGKQFIVDRWERGDTSKSSSSSSNSSSCSSSMSDGKAQQVPPAGSTAGYGITRVLEGGNVLEKAAANVTVVHGRLSDMRAKAMSSRQGYSIAAGTPYFAAALSLVFHPAHPLVPTFRSDIRYFEVDGSQGWFGGGADLTPSYVFEDDVKEFHTFYRDICNRHGTHLYARMKADCDSYFYLPARREHRGTGGIFFDDLSNLNPPTSNAESAVDNTSDPSTAIDAAYAFVRDVGEGFMRSYWPIVERRRSLPCGERERQWQLLRRGRYLEFNLLYDRGVRFGMDGSGRVESIMVSAPPLIAWKYRVEPEPGTPEAALVDVLKHPRNWI